MLNETRLKSNLIDLYHQVEAAGGDTREAQLEYFCEQLAIILVNEIKQLKITYTNGLTAASNPVVGVLNHTVS